MTHELFGHGYSPTTISRAKCVYCQAWRWRVNHRDEWQSILETAHDKAARGEHIRVLPLIDGVIPHRFAPLVARWLKGEYPRLIPLVETRRSVFDLFSG